MPRNYKKPLDRAVSRHYKKHMDITFDPTKDEANLAKHGLSFADFGGFDATPVVVADARFAEPRFRAYGFVDGEARCLAFTVRDEVIRAISLRRAHAKELRRYGL